VKVYVNLIYDMRYMSLDGLSFLHILSFVTQSSQMFYIGFFFGHIAKILSYITFPSQCFLSLQNCGNSKKQ